MRITLAAAALGLSLAGVASAADFEGVMESRITVTGKAGHGQGPGEEGGTKGVARLYVAAPGARMETEVHTPMGAAKITVLHLKDKPGSSYSIDEEQKTYFEMKLHDPPAARDEEPEKFTVKKLSPERVAGYECVHALVTTEKGERTELWVSKALGGAEAFWAAQAGEGGSGRARRHTMVRAMRDAGLDGWPLKVRTWPESGGEVLWETTRVERKSLPRSLFSLSGYTRSEHGVGQMQLSPEQRKRMEEAMQRQREAMKKMSPEQRKQMEEMMKSMQGGGAK